MAALLGLEVINKDYETIRIRIAFNPVEKRFEVSNPAIQKDAAWIGDIAEVFAPKSPLVINRLKPISLNWLLSARVNQ